MGKNALRILIAIVFMTRTIIICDASDLSDSDMAINASNEAAYNYGPDYMKMNKMHSELVKMNRDEINLRNMIEKRSVKEAHGDSNDIDLKGPRVGNEPSATVSTETIIETIISEEGSNMSENTDVLDAIVDHLNDRQTVIVEYESVYSNGRYKVFWRECDNEFSTHYSVIYGLFDDAGKIIGEEQYLSSRNIGNPESYSHMKVSECPNGNIMFIWHQGGLLSYYEERNEHDDFCMQMFNADGEKVGIEHSLIGPDGIRSCNIHTPYVFEDTGIVALMWEYTTVQTEYILKIEFYDQESNKIGESYKTPGNQYARPYLNSIRRIHELSNGNLALFWFEMNPTNNYRSKMMVIDKNGYMSGEEHIIDELWLNDKDMDNMGVENLADGNFAVFWGCKSEAKYFMQVYDTSGIDLSGRIIMTDSYYYGKHVLLQNGNIVFFSPLKENRLVSQIRMDIFDQNGVRVKNCVIDQLENNICCVEIHDIKVLPNGNIALFWYAIKRYKPGCRTLHMRIFTSEGIALTSTHSMFESEEKVYTQTIENIGVFDNGNMIVFYRGQARYIVEGDNKDVFMNRYRVFDMYGNQIGDEGEIGCYNYGEIFNKIISIDGEKIAFVWGSRWSSTYGIIGNSCARMRIINSSGEFVGDEIELMSNDDTLKSRYQKHVLLPDGNMAIFWDENNYETFYMQIISGAGKKVSDPFLLSDSLPESLGGIEYINIHKIALTDSDNIEVIWHDHSRGPVGTIRKSLFDKSGKMVDAENIDRGYGKEVINTSPTYAYNVDKPISSSYSMDWWLYFWRDIRSSVYMTDYDNDNGSIGDMDSNGMVNYQDMSLDRASTLQDGSISIYGVIREIFSFSVTDPMKTALYMQMDENKNNDNLEGVVNLLMEEGIEKEIDKAIINNAIALIEEQAYMDEELIEEFKETVQLVMVAEAMGDIVGTSDFMKITETLYTLEKERIAMYEEYLDMTDAIYTEIVSILGINIEEEVLPETFISIAGKNPKASRKIIVDSVLKDLHDKDEENLNEDAKKALHMEKTLLAPIRNRYVNALSSIIRRFTSAMRTLLQDQAAVSLSGSEDSFKALFLLDKEKMNVRNF